MRMMLAAANPVSNTDVKIKKSNNTEKTTKSDFDKTLNDRVESKKNDIPKESSKVTDKTENKRESVDKKSIISGENKRSTDIKESNINISVLTTKTVSKETKDIKKIDIKTEDVKNRKDSKTKNSDKELETIQLSSMIQPQKELTNEKTEIKETDKTEAKEVKELKVDKTNSGENVKVNLNGLNSNQTRKDIKDVKSSRDLSSKKSEKKEEKSTVKVNDLRTRVDEVSQSNKSEKSEVGVVRSSSETVLDSSDQLESSSERTIVLGTTEVTAEGDGGKTQAPVLKEASSFLKQQLKEFGNSEIVKQTRFILKDNNVGEIKLILKPEALGEVKINLNLNENSLAGQIVVENSSVREIFQENLSSLGQALEKEGFENPELELSLSDKGQQEQREKRENKQYFSERLKRFDNNGQVVRYGLPTAGINLTA